ncbi:MAG: hypothetical protein NC390_01800 [Fusobacterium sp.]|nr:hypothetical protein [Fusobacterium sp.]
MKISAINALKYNQQNTIRNHSQQRPQSTQNGVYNPAYYTDYNVRINFGKRSPEDFYAQEFNKNHMPETMHKYLYEKFDERSKIAPVQIMQEAYDDLSLASTTDDIKELFPDKQFQKLRPANYSTATTGVLKKIKDIKAMQEAPEPLFKDGNDDLTTYLVKKIYLEGKTVKEIDKDFAKDINEIYELAARVPDNAVKGESAYFSHSTLYNLGIRFPDVPFWNSFIATRDDYERTNRVKTVTGAFVNADSIEGKAEIARRQIQRAQEPPKPRRYNFKRHNLKQISDNIVNSRGETSKALKKSSRNAEELTFLQKYWSQIMSVATEKVHLSEELIDFNAHRKDGQSKVETSIMDKLISGADLNSSESTPFKIFWNERTDLKGHFSNAITDTIMLFTDEFGADGKNPRFEALLDYANGIKPEREARKLQHAATQAEYDELAKTLPPLEETKPNAHTQVQELKTLIQKAQPEEFTYIIDGKEIKTPFDIKIQSKLGIENDLILIPKPLTSLYTRELNEITKADQTRFWLSTSFQPENVPEEIKPLIYSEEQLREINRKLIEVMETKYNPQIEATRFAIFEYADSRGLLTPEYIMKNARRDILFIRNELLEDAQKTGRLDKAQQEIDSIFKRVFTPLTNKEKMSIRQDLFNYLKNYNTTKTMYPNLFIPHVLHLISENMNKEKGVSEDIKSMLKTESIPLMEGPVLRQLLIPQTHPEIKNIISERAVQHIISDFPELISLIATSDEARFKQVMSPFPQEMIGMLQLAKRAVINHWKLK